MGPTAIMVSALGARCSGVMGNLEIWRSSGRALTHRSRLPPIQEMIVFCTKTMTMASAFSAPKRNCVVRHIVRSFPSRTDGIVTIFKGKRFDRRLRLLALDDGILRTTDVLGEVPTKISSSYGLTPIPEFEPILNIEAASSFIIIAVIFTLLQIRVSAISNAAQRRSNALIALREAESLLLSGGGRYSKSDEDFDCDKDLSSNRRYSTIVTAAKKEYEDALRAEMNLRSVAPGVRLIAPNDPRRNEEDRAAAKRFLGWGSEEFGDTETTSTRTTDNEWLQIDERRKSAGNVKRVDDGGGDNADINGLSNAAKIVLVGVASMLLVLLYTLSFDPMAI